MSEKCGNAHDTSSHLVNQETSHDMQSYHMIDTVGDTQRDFDALHKAMNDTQQLGVMTKR